MRLGNRQPDGFTLVESLLALGVIALLLSFMLPALQRAREAADRLVCQNNLRQIGLAFTMFHDDHRRLPLAADAFFRMGPATSFNWPVYLLPYLEQDQLYANALGCLAVNPDPRSAPHHPVLRTFVKLLACPLDGRLRRTQEGPGGLTAAFMSYLGVGGGTAFSGMLPRGRSGIALAEVTDGLSYTLLVGERTPPDDFSVGEWYATFHPAFGNPNYSIPVELGMVVGPCQGTYRFGPGRTDNPCDRMHFWSLHPGGANFLFGDGSVRYLPYSMRPLMVALGTRAGGEAVELPD